VLVRATFAPPISTRPSALQDRMSIFAYEEWQADASNPKALRIRLEQTRRDASSAALADRRISSIYGGQGIDDNPHTRHVPQVRMDDQPPCCVRDHRREWA
jgi:hypothetical protein